MSLAWLRRNPTALMLVVALVAVAVLYGPTVGHALVNYDDPWLYRENWIARDPSWASLRAIWFDLSGDTRFVLGAEYLPVRDMSVMIDHAVWGDWYGGYHLTNLIIYAGAIILWFAAGLELGIERRVVGIMTLVWAVHPAHAESVAWLSERKGLLGVMFAGAAVLAYARYRSGGRTWWLVLGAITAAFGVWSKAPTAFALAALPVLDLCFPERRASVRRSVTGLAVIGTVAAAAFVPVLLTATASAVVDTADHAPAGRLEMAMGIHGVYAQLGVLAMRNAPSYPIAIAGPSTLDIVIGVVTLALALAVAVLPCRGRWQWPVALRAASALWLLGWFPASRLVLPLRNVLVADRFLLIPTLGIALAAGVGLARIASNRARIGLIAAIVLAAGLRTLDARGTWEDSETLWQRAVASNPADGNAWAIWAEALMENGRDDIAFDVLYKAIRISDTPRLKTRLALFTLARGKRSDAMRSMREAAVAGEYRAMANLALLLHQDGAMAEALDWARRSTVAAPRYVNGLRARGKIALAAGQPAEALEAFERAYRLEPRNLSNRYNLGLALTALGREPEARAHFTACLEDTSLAPKARVMLGAGK